MSNTIQAEEFTYEAEMSQLLHLIIHSLYSHREIFLRELISNSCDALSKVRIEELTNKDILDAGSELKITIEVDEEKGQIIVSDNGIGMTRDEMKASLGTIAKSGTREFIEKLKESKDGKADELIGQFGVGFYSVFMVCDEVEVESRSYSKDSKGFRWKSKGEGSYTIEEIEKEGRGTRIIIPLNDNGKEFKAKYTIEQIIKKYSDFVPFNVYVDDKVANKGTAIWQKQEKDVTEDELNEFYKYISQDFENPLGHKHLNIEGKVMFKSLLFFPSHAPQAMFREQEESALNLYVKRVFIQDDNKDLLPQYLRFVKGVVDTESLPLNVSREVTQYTPVMKKIQEILTNNVLKQLEQWSEKDAEKFSNFYRNFGSVLKEGIHYDYERKDRLVKLMRFESSTLEAGQLTSLADYVSRMRSDQKEIYFIFGPDRETALKNPALEYCKKNDLEVLLLLDPIDEFLMPGVGEFEGKQIVSVLKAEFDHQPDSADSLSEAEQKELIDKIKEVLGENVKDVVASKRLIDSPAALVPDKDGMDQQVERMMRMMNKDFTGSKPVFEINPASKIIRNLSAKFKVSADNPVISEIVWHLFQTAQLLDGNLSAVGDYLHRTNSFLEKLTEV